MEEYDSWSVDISDENNTEWSASGDYSQYDEVCSRENGDLKKVFLPIVYAIIFVMGIVGNGLVVIVMGYQKKSKTMTGQHLTELKVHIRYTMEEYDSWSIDFSDENNTEGSASGDYREYNEVCSRENGDLRKIFLPIVYAIIFVMGIVGNGLVVIVMGYQKKSKTMTDKYRLHLSIADLLFVLTLPFWAVDAASSWYFGSFLCKIVNSIYTINLYSSVLILAFISLDRYLAVVRATNSQKPRRLLAEKVIYVGVWLPAALLTVPDLVFAQVHGEGTRMMCDRAYPIESSYIWMTVFRFQHIFVGLVLPGLVILTCYCIIISKLSQGSKGLQKRRALKTTIILILAFFICWLPYCIAILVDTLTLLNVIQHSCTFQQHMETWIFITEALAYFHCCLNPILYAFLGVKFKKSAKSALTVNSRGSSLKILSKNKRGGLSSVSTESESSSFQSS